MRGILWILPSLLLCSPELIFGQSPFAQEASDWRQVAGSMPLGSRIRVQTVDGRRISGTLMRVESSEMLVKRNARYPEPAIKVTFTDVAKIERHKGGASTSPRRSPSAPPLEPARC